MATVPASRSAAADRPVPPGRPSSGLRTVLLLIAAVVVASAAGTAIGLAAIAAGASAAFAPITAVAIVPSVVVGVTVGYLGWRIVRRLTGASVRVMRVLVPVVVVLSLVPDALLLATGFIPGSSVTAVVGLMLMHPLVAAVAVPVYQRLAPVAEAAPRLE